MMLNYYSLQSHDPSAKEHSQETFLLIINVETVLFFFLFYLFMYLLCKMHCKNIVGLTQN